MTEVLKIADEPLLVSRKDAARMLGGVCTATLARLEKTGLLTVVRLDPRRSKSQAFYRLKDVQKLTRTNAVKPKRKAPSARGGA